MTEKTAPPTISQMRSTWREDDEDLCGGLVPHDELLAGTRRRSIKMVFVAYRASDETYWAVEYLTENDGDYNDLRDGDLLDSDVHQVRAVTRTVQHYERVPR